MVLQSVAFDIETTGFGVDDVVTVAGFAMPLGVRVFVQTDGRSAEGVSDAVTTATGSDTTVRVSTHADEHKLLEAVSWFAGERLQGESVLLVAYNGERFRGGFDVPFLRTRYAQRDVAWPFTGVPYADVLPLVTDRFNTTVDEDDHSDLVGVYDVLCSGSYSDLYPFSDSAEAVTAFETGQFDKLVLHNVADVLRTQALARLAERYCSKADFDVKSLTPVIDE